MTGFLQWFDSNRKPIGTLVGGLDIILGVSHLVQGNIPLATMWTAIGIVILIDAWKGED